MMNEKVILTLLLMGYDEREGILTLLLMGYDEREGNTHFITHGI